jgi:bone morphogenetic protein receptor type-1B
MSIQCCNDYDECNKDLQPQYEPRSTTPAPITTDASILYLALIISFLACVFICFVTIVIFYNRYVNTDFLSLDNSLTISM